VIREGDAAPVEGGLRVAIIERDLVGGLCSRRHGLELLRQQGAMSAIVVHETYLVE
jgi:hypothetical protein